MSNDYQIKKPKDLTKFNQNDFGELLWWSFQLGVTVERLVTEIQKHGTDVKEISRRVKNGEQSNPG